MAELDWLGGRKCAWCGKEFDVLWPHLYRYRREQRFLCSWSCLRAYDRSKEEKDMSRKRLTLEQKKKAVEIAIAGGSPFDYLKKCGSADAYSAWKKIKETLKEADPETFAKLPKRIGAKKEEPEAENIREIVEAGRAAAEMEPAGMNQEEKPFRHFSDIVKEEPRRTPLNYDGFTVTSVRGKFGEWHMDAQHNSLDFHGADGEEMFMRPEAWKEFMGELERVIAILGA